MVRRKEVRLAMPEIVLRVRLIGGDHVDATYEEADAVDQDTVTEHAIATLTRDASALRTRHGDRLVVCTAAGPPASGCHRAARSCDGPRPAGIAAAS